MHREIVSVQVGVHVSRRPVAERGTRLGGRMAVVAHPLSPAGALGSANAREVAIAELAGNRSEGGLQGAGGVPALAVVVDRCGWLPSAPDDFLVVAGRPSLQEGRSHLVAVRIVDRSAVDVDERDLDPELFASAPD